MEMNNSTITKFRRDFAAAVAGLESKYNIKIDIGSISYNSAEFHTRMDIRNLTESGEKMINPNHESKAIQHFLFRFGDDVLKRGVIGQQFRTVTGEIITIMDYDSRKSKYPVIYSKYGKTYKCCIAHIDKYN